MLSILFFLLLPSLPASVYFLKFLIRQTIPKHSLPTSPPVPMGLRIGTLGDFIASMHLLFKTVNLDY